MVRPGTWRRTVALVTALAIAAPAGAIAQALGHGECHSCPPTCAMHQPGKPRCHEGVQQPKAPDRSPGCKLSQRGCGQHGGERAFELPPAVMPPSELALEAAPMIARAPAPTLVVGRNADPPETPPPVARG
jgi:hypothetical protein